MEYEHAVAHEDIFVSRKIDGDRQNGQAGASN